MAGIGLFPLEIGAVTYYRGRKATALLRGAEYRDSLCDTGIRVPLGDRFSHVCAAPNWGCLQESNVPGDVILLPDFRRNRRNGMMLSPRRSRRYEARGGGGPETMDLLLRCVKQHIGSWRFSTGSGKKEERLQAIHTLERLRDSHPDLFTLRIIAGAWGK